MDKRRVEPGYRNAAGMFFSHECRLHYFFGWLAWLIAIWALLFAEYTIRVPEGLGFYMVEAFFALLSPFIAMFLADEFTIGRYRRILREVDNLNLGQRILDNTFVDSIRNELRGNLLLRWFRPPKTDNVGSQLFIAALWYRAMIVPEGAPASARYGEWIRDVFLGYIPLLIGGVITLTFFSIGTDNAFMPPHWMQALAAMFAGIGLATIGHSQLRFTVRRQAILDYFTTWMGDVD